MLPKNWDNSTELPAIGDAHDAQDRTLSERRLTGDEPMDAGHEATDNTCLGLSGKFSVAAVDAVIEDVSRKCQGILLSSSDSQALEIGAGAVAFSVGALRKKFGSHGRLLCEVQKVTAARVSTRSGIGSSLTPLKQNEDMAPATQRYDGSIISERASTLEALRDKCV